MSEERIWTSIGRLLKLQRGYDLTRDERSVGEIPVYGAAGQNGFHNEAKSKAPGIIVGRSGGSFGQVHFVKEDFWPHNTAMFVSDFKGNEPYFLYYLLKSLDFSRLNSGSAQPSLNRNYIYPVKLKAPKDYNSQRRIASVLANLDSKIELNNRINAELEAMAKLIYDYWFVQFDFPDEKGRPYKSSGGKMVYNHELKREIPEGWGKVSLLEVGDIIGGSTPSRAKDEYFAKGGEGTSWITPKDLSIHKGKKFISYGELDVTDAGRKSASLKIMPTGTVLLTSRAPVGYMAIAREPVTTNQGFKSIVPNDGFSTEYVFHTVQLYLPAIIKKATGSTFAEISSSTLKTIEIASPSKKLIDEFTVLAAPIFKKQDLLEQENQELASLRDWLLPMLMNGQVKVGKRKDYETTEELQLVAEINEVYENHVDSEQKEMGRYEKTALGGHIINMHYSEGFGRTQLMKLLHLTEYGCKLPLNTDYKKFAAGPYNEVLVREIEDHLKRFRFFKIRQEFTGNHRVHYRPLAAASEIETQFKEHFKEDAPTIDAFLSKFKGKSWSECEIISTLYAVWNNRIIQNQQISDNLLKEDFLAWDPKKSKYKDQLDDSLKWMRENGVVPEGWGTLIRKRIE